MTTVDDLDVLRRKAFKMVYVTMCVLTLCTTVMAYQLGVIRTEKSAKAQTNAVYASDKASKLTLKEAGLYDRSANDLLRAPSSYSIYDTNDVMVLKYDFKLNRLTLSTNYFALAEIFVGDEKVTLQPIRK